MADKKTVILDAGHGGQNPGAVYMERLEKDDALRLTLAVGDILEDSGVDVVYTRVDDATDSPLEKAQIANNSGGDYFVSIHRNAMPVPGSASGQEVLVYEDQGTAALLAENIGRGLTEAGFRDLGVKERPGLIVLRRTRMPAVLVEAGFIDNPQDNQLFDQNFQQIAQGIAQGILNTIQQEQESRPEYYQVQTGAFRLRQPAQAMVQELTARGLPAFMVYDQGYYKVRVGAFLNMDNAARMERRLRSLGYSTLMVRERAIGI